MSTDTIQPETVATEASRRLRDSSAALLAQAEGLRDSSAALLTQARGWRPRSLAPQSTALAGPRLVALDAARVLATFGVMWTHLAEAQGQNGAWAALGRFGTSFYILAAVYLATRSALKRPDEPFCESLAKRARRLLVPFVLWSTLYGLYYAAVALPLGESFAELTLWWGPFAGTARHLWFLPFAFAAGTAATVIAPRLMTLTTRRLLLVGLASVVGLYWFCYRVLFFALNRTWAVEWHLHRMDRWIEELPLMVLAIFATALYVRLARSRTPGELALGEGVHGRSLGAGASDAPVSVGPLQTATSVPAGLALLAGFVLVEISYVGGYDFLKTASQSEGRFLANAAGIALLGGFLALGGGAWMNVLAPLGRLTYFAFLAHVLLIDVGNAALMPLPGYGSLGFSLLSALLLFALAVTLGAVARRFRVLRWLIP